MKKENLLLVTALTFSVFPAKSDDVSYNSKIPVIEIIDALVLSKTLKQVSIVDARQSQFKKGHIPYSQNMDWENWTEEKPGLKNALFGDSSKWGRTLTNNSVQNRLRQLGLSHDKQIVVVGDGKNSWGQEGRIAWNLLFWGAKHVALLDGGYPRWLQLKLPIEIGKAKSTKAGDFVYSLNPQRRATKADIFKNLKTNERSLLDIRSREEFDGYTMPGQKRGGHIPKSQLVEFSSLYQNDGRFIDTAHLKKLIGDRISTMPITYCTGGVRSALLALLLEAKLGIYAANYDASMWEWSSDEKLPIEKTISK